MKQNLELDDIDLQIISIMLDDAKTSYADIGQKLFISGGTVHVRLKKLSEQLVITGSKLNVDFSKLGFDIIAFIGIFLEKSHFYPDVVNALKEIPEIVSAHYTTGNYSIFTRVMCKDTDHLREVLSNKIQKIEGIQRTETFISLEESINRAPQIVKMKENQAPK